MQLESNYLAPEEEPIFFPNPPLKPWGSEKLSQCAQIASLARLKSEKFSEITAHANYSEMKEGQQQMENKIERHALKMSIQRSRDSYLDEPPSAKREKK